MQDQPDDQQMQGIVEVEEPFHKAVQGLVLSSLSIIQPEKGKGKNHAHLQDSVKLIYGKKVDNGINPHIENQPEGLRLKIPAVGSEGKDAQSGNAAPVAGEADKADKKNQYNS